MLDQLSAIKFLHESQRRWKRTCLIGFIVVIAINSSLFVIVPKDLSGLLYQFLLIVSMLAVFGLVFLDTISFFINKQLNKKDVFYKNLLQHSKADDIHKDIELIEKLIKDRRIASQEFKNL